MRSIVLFCKKHPSGALIAGCYLLGICVLLSVQLAGLIRSRIAYASGALTPAELTVAHFEPGGDLLVQDGMLISTGTDPQLLLKNRGLRVENLAITASYNQNPLLQQVFWAAPGREYTIRHTAYPKNTADTYDSAPITSVFTLPPGGVMNLRLDVASAAGTAINIRRIVINQKPPFYRFLLPSAGALLLLASVPGLAACALWTLWAGILCRRPSFRKRRARR